MHNTSVIMQVFWLPRNSHTC